MGTLDPQTILNHKEKLHSEWLVVDGHHLEREFSFENFAKALEFVNKVGALAEEAGHHPEIVLGWGKAKISLWTHSTGGLSAADFSLAQNIDSIS